jgi:dTDP-N-acetylfucosamine:lipid II N-acetylfucosaminyltransferase
MHLKKIVNIMPDDKFLDYYIEMSEQFLPGASSYVILADALPLKYVKSEHESLLVVPRNKAAFEQLLNALNFTQVVVFHSFQLPMQAFIKAIPANIKKIWIFWGFEGYRAFPKNRFVGMRTHLAMYEPSVKGKVRGLWDRFKGNFLLRKHLASRDIIRQMDYLATFVQEDEAMISSIHPKIKTVSFNYYTRELMKLDEIPIQPLDLNRLLLGNSGDPTNNHIEALYYLHRIQYQGEITCPLSYGGKKDYVERVCSLGTRLFGKQFHALRTFMPVNVYHEIINSCGIVWMNHKRQQAAGNLLVSFISAKVIILDQANPLNETFKAWGLTYYHKEVLLNLDKIDTTQIRQNRLQVLNRVGMEQNEAFFSILNP